MMVWPLWSLPLWSLVQQAAGVDPVHQATQAALNVFCSSHSTANLRALEESDPDIGRVFLLRRNTEFPPWWEGGNFSSTSAFKRGEFEVAALGEWTSGHWIHNWTSTLALLLGWYVAIAGVRTLSICQERTASCLWFYGAFTSLQAKWDPGHPVQVWRMCQWRQVYSQSTLVVPTLDQRAETVAQVLVVEWFCKFGVPGLIHSD